MDDFGGLNTDMEDINVFNARNKLGYKINRIQELASQLAADGYTDKNTCTALLGEFLTACEGDSCVNPNEHLLQLSVNDICSAVNTRSKLKVEVIGQYYDFRNWAVRSQEVSFICR